MMKKRKLHILGLSETRDKYKGRKTIHEEYIYISSGDASGKHGVVIVVNNKTGACISSFENINNRIAKISVRAEDHKLAIIQIDAPQKVRPKDEKDQFYDNLQDVIDTYSADEQINVMGDFNKHVGTERQGFEGNIGHFGIGDRNEDG